MTLHLTGIAKWNTRIFALMAAASSLGSLVPSALAQGPIRVETNQVLVPVVVVDKERFGRVWKDGSLYTNLPGVLNAIASSVLVHDLTAADFQVFDDGKGQPIQNVTEETLLYWNVRDNGGHHTEYIGPGGGKWSTAEWRFTIGDIDFPQYYVVAYTVPGSPEGSCHRISVKVNRPNTLVAARNEYCNTEHSASDPLKGTTLGTQMENYPASKKNGKVNISAQVVALYADGDAARVHIVLDWPWESLKAESRTKGVLAMVFDKEGSLVTRLSDLAGRGGISDRDWPSWDGHHRGLGLSEMGLVENRYETQIKLPPGEYDLRVVLGDGKEFGRAEIPFTVDVFDRKELAISAISLCKQIDDVSASSSGRPSALAGAWTAKSLGSYVPLVSDDIEFKPTGNTRFKKDETLYTYFEVYEPLLATEPSTTVEIRVRIVDLKTGEVRSDSPPVSATPYVKAGSPVIPIGRKTNISNLPKGSYRLDVQATDSAGKSTAWRSANFTVE
jgi:hypothetical protein